MPIIVQNAENQTAYSVLMCIYWFENQFLILLSSLKLHEKQVSVCVGGRGRS